MNKKVLCFVSLVVEAISVLQCRSAVQLRQVSRSSEADCRVCKASTAGQREDGERSVER